ncbi:MAG TPA: M15 family metallopeptidase [Actinomycetota bacterium]
MRRGATVAAALAGAIAGATGVLSIPSRTLPPSPPPVVPAVLGPAPVGTLLAWTPGRLPPGFVGASRAAPGVQDVAVVRSGVAWLSGWRDTTGADRRPPQGLAFPVEVAAIDPEGYAAFVPASDRASVTGLAGGGALLSETAAELRGVGPGASLTVGGRTLHVTGVIGDELVGAHELVVSRKVGADLGITRPRYLLIDPRDGEARGRIERHLRRALPEGIRLRVRGPGEAPVFRHGDAVLPPLRLKELFGEFAAQPRGGGFLRPDPGWVEGHIRTARVPVLGSVTCHRALIPQLRHALREVEGRGLGGYLDPATYAGCYSPRYADRDPSGGLSHHSWGVAFDVNVTENPQGRRPRLDRRVVEVFERWGFTWGGTWLIPDGMHFEFLTYPTG